MSSFPLPGPWSCPAWCTLPPGHGFEALTEVDAVGRSHQRPVHPEGAVIEVYLVQDETILRGGLGGVVVDDPELLLPDQGQDICLDETTARQCAQVLIAGADHLARLAHSHDALSGAKHEDQQ